MKMAPTHSKELKRGPEEAKEVPLGAGMQGDGVVRCTKKKKSIKGETKQAQR